MIELQMLSEVPEWARERGLSDDDFDILEQIALKPKRMYKLLIDREYAQACGILNALQYAKDKGLLQ